MEEAVAEAELEECCSASNSSVGFGRNPGSVSSGRGNVPGSGPLMPGSDLSRFEVPNRSSTELLVGAARAEAERLRIDLMNAEQRRCAQTQGSQTARGRLGDTVTDRRNSFDNLTTTLLE